MKVFLSFTVVSFGLLLLTGCASTGTTYQNAPRQHENIVTDKAYVAVVEYVARHRGTRVVWVNPPKKRVVETVASSQ